MIKSCFDAPPETAGFNRSQTTQSDEKSKPGFALTVVLLSVFVAVTSFAVVVFLVDSVWWAVLIAYTSQLIFVLLMFGVFLGLNPSEQPQSPYEADVPTKINNSLIATKLPVWLSYQPKSEDLNRVFRVAVSAANNRDSRKCCEWLAEHGCEVHLCSDHDTLISDVIAKPDRWSLLILDVDHIGGAQDVDRELEYIRSGLSLLPILFLINRSDRDTPCMLAAVDRNLILSKPFYRKSLFAALNSFNLQTARDGH